MKNSRYVVKFFGVDMELLLLLRRPSMTLSNTLTLDVKCNTILDDLIKGVINIGLYKSEILSEYSFPQELDKKVDEATYCNKCGRSYES